MIIRQPHQQEEIFSRITTSKYSNPLDFLHPKGFYRLNLIWVSQKHLPNHRYTHIQFPPAHAFFLTVTSLESAVETVACLPNALLTWDRLRGSYVSLQNLKGANDTLVTSILRERAIPATNA
jgi:hypothetical protein